MIINDVSCKNFRISIFKILLCLYDRLMIQEDIFKYANGRKCPQLYSWEC